MFGISTSNYIGIRNIYAKKSKTGAKCQLDQGIYPQISIQVNDIIYGCSELPKSLECYDSILATLLDSRLEKYTLSSMCSAQICLCAEIFRGHSAQMDDCAKNFGASLAQMDVLKVKKLVKEAKKVGNYKS